MNQSFDAGRWWLLVAKHWSENSRKYTLSLLAIAGLLLLWFVVVLLTYDGYHFDDVQISSYYTGLFLVGCLYGSMLFADLGSKTKGLHYLSVPASQLEKLLCALFYGVVVFFVVYTALFYVLDIAFVKAGQAVAHRHWLREHGVGTIFTPPGILNVFYLKGRGPNDANVFLYILLFYFVLQSAFICGSIYFVRFSFIKTVLSLLVTGLLVTFLIAKVIYPILPAGSYYHGLTSYQVYTVKDAPAVQGVMIYSNAATDKLVALPAWIDDVLLFLVKFAFAPLLWLATYFRLKEKEI